MAYDHQRPSEATATATATTIAVVIVLFLLGGIVIVGAGFFFYSRAEMMESNERQAVAALMRAEALAAKARAEATQAVVQDGSRMRAISIELAEDGTIVADEKGIDLRELKSMLTEAAEEGTIRLEVTIHVDGRCPFRHVAAVQGACKQSGVTQIHVLVSADSEQPVPSPPPED